MRSLFMLIFGVVCGVIATVLLFSLDTTFDSDPDEGAVGGNARLVFDEAGLAAIIRDGLPELEGFATISLVDVEVREEGGVIIVELGAGGSGVGITGEVVLDPNIVDGRLQLDVADAHLGSFAVPEPLAQLIEDQLSAALDNLDPAIDYRLVAITTRDRQVTLEVEL
ncbi:MAG: hypothetical protein WD557_11050 [Dehalococcoidia bacterium]